MSIGPMISLADVREAARRIAGHIVDTPVVTGRGGLDQLISARLLFKCENFQRVGAFKFRGAMNAVLSLSVDQRAAGVATHSSGNHAAALALSARLCATNAEVVMPSNSSPVKIDSVRAYGARIHLCEPTLAAREQELQRVVAATGAHFIHPFDDWRVIAGQGTATLELLEAHPDIDLLLAPVGGGGLLSGSAIAAKALAPRCAVIGVEPAVTDDARRSFLSGEVEAPLSTDTIADGLRTSLGQRTLLAIRQHVDDVVTVTENEIVAAMQLLWQRLKILIEPSAAVPFAALLAEKVSARGKTVGIILSGGNADLNQLPWVTRGTQPPDRPR